MLIQRQLKKQELNLLIVRKSMLSKLKKVKSFIFTAKVIVKPEVKLGEYKGIEVEKFDTTVTDEDVDNEIKHFKKNKLNLL